MLIMHQSIFNVYTLINLHIGSILSVTKKWWEIKHLLYQTAANGCLSVRLWLGPQLIIAAFFDCSGVTMSHLGIKQTLEPLKEGGQASESAFEWLQLNQNKERLIAKYEFFGNTGQKANKIFFNICIDDTYLNRFLPCLTIINTY